jgi:hypothetical protein
MTTDARHEVKKVEVKLKKQQQTSVYSMLNNFPFLLCSPTWTNVLALQKMYERKKQNNSFPTF